MKAHKKQEAKAEHETEINKKEPQTQPNIKIIDDI